MSKQTGELSVEIAGTVEEFETTHAACSIAMRGALHALREWKPNDRSEIDRRYAVTITMMEQAYAYFRAWVVDAGTGVETDETA